MVRIAVIIATQLDRLNQWAASDDPTNTTARIVAGIALGLTALGCLVWCGCAVAGMFR